jgi:hypothetical protein
MEKFWKAALAVGGIAAIGAFVFWSLYRQWLSLPIFSQLSQEQTFAVMKIFLWLTFGSLLLFAILFLTRSLPSRAGADHVFELHESWKGVNEIDCDRLVGPDVTSAARAMTITASSWLNGLVDKRIIVENHFQDFDLLYTALRHCERIVPGFEKRALKCSDFLSDEMHRAYKEMKRFTEDQPL